MPSREKKNQLGERFINNMRKYPVRSVGRKR